MRNFTLSLLIAATTSSFGQYVSLDPAFGNNGVAAIDMIPSSDIYYYNAFTGCLQSDGKTVVAGHVFTNNTLRTDFALTRFNPDGTVDTNFGNAGRVIFDFLQRENSIVDVLQMPDGRLAALAHTFLNNLGDITVAALHPDGSLDTSVGFNGIRFLGTSYYDEPASMKLLSDGKILISAMTYNAEVSQMFTLYRLNADFTLDTTFGTNGRRHYPELGNIGEKVHVTQTADGNMLATYTNLDFDTGTGWDIVVAKLLTDGSVDTGLGTKARCA